LDASRNFGKVNYQSQRQDEQEQRPREE
jgi:hypothetical protein